MVSNTYNAPAFRPFSTNISGDGAVSGARVRLCSYSCPLTSASRRVSAHAVE